MFSLFVLYEKKVNSVYVKQNYFVLLAEDRFARELTRLRLDVRIVMNLSLVLVFQCLAGNDGSCAIRE